MIFVNERQQGVMRMIQVRNIYKHFDHKTVLQNVTLEINEGEIYGIIGASGAGKSTLLRVMNLLEKPEKGEVFVRNKLLSSLKPNQLREARKSIGMIFQHFYLVQNKTVYENVEVALKLANYPKRQIQRRVEECLQFVGLQDLQGQYPAQLSGGQKQRVAIARALANNPKILLCDEPTSALDPHTTEEILLVLQNIHVQFGVTIVIVSHEMNVIKSICQRVTVLDNGRVYDTVKIEPTGVKYTKSTAQRFVNELIGGEAT